MASLSSRLRSTDWASLSNGIFLPLGAVAGYQTGNASYTPASNIDVGNGDAPAAGFTVNTLRFNASGIGLTLAGVNTISTGGLLVTGNAASGGTVSGGTITSGGGSELVVVNFGSLNIGAVIADNGTPSALTVGGSGATTLSAANAYSGVTYLDNGRLNLANPNALGPNNGGLYISGGTLDNTSGSDFTLPGDRAQTWNGDFTYAGRRTP